MRLHGCWSRTSSRQLADCWELLLQACALTSRVSSPPSAHLGSAMPVDLSKGSGPLSLQKVLTPTQVPEGGGRVSAPGLEASGEGTRRRWEGCSGLCVPAPQREGVRGAHAAGLQAPAGTRTAARGGRSSACRRMLSGWPGLIWGRGRGPRPITGLGLGGWGGEGAVPGK